MAETDKDYSKIAEKYCKDILKGKIPAGKFVKAACKRQIDDLKQWAKTGLYKFDKEKASRVCEFIEGLPHIKGPLTGQLIILEPWQIFILTTIFGWVNRKSGARRYRRAYIEVPKGNGKSSIAAGVGLYMLCADNEGGAECYSAARVRDQAKIVFETAQHMARKTPELKKYFNVEVLAHAIVVLNEASTFSALSSDANSLDGKITHFAAVDELHAHRTREVYDTMEASIGKRTQPLLFVITTAGSNRAGICYEVRSFVIKTLTGKSKDESQFGIIYGLDKKDNWTTLKALKKANPNWGVSVDSETVIALQHKAMTMASAANNFKTKHLNEWVNADTAWMNMRKWEDCKDMDMDIEDFHGEPCYIALDLASKVNIAAKMKLFPREIEGKIHYFLFGDYYLPRETVDRGENDQYSGWESLGLLHVTEGAVIDFDLIEEHLISECSLFDVKEIPYDPWQATQLATHLMAQEAPMVEIRPTIQNFSESMKTLEALVLEKRLHHNGDPILEWMISNVVCHTDAKDNIYPRKEREENLIDGVVATLMALNRALAEKEDEGVVFERGVVCI